MEAYELSEEGLSVFKEDSTSLDTHLFHFYNSYSAYKSEFPFLDLGYEGSPMIELREIGEQAIELSIGNPALDYYQYDNELKRIHTKRPLSRLNYSQGQNELIFIEAKHAQQISERLTFGIDYRRLKNQNFYYSNLANADRVRFANVFNTKFYTGYYTPKRKYELLAGFIWNKTENIETGGLVSDSVFESTLARNKLSNNEVYLSDALNSYRNHNFKVTQYFRLGGSTADSTRYHDLSRFYSQIVVKTLYRSSKMEYFDNDADSAYYSKKLGSIHDSMHQSKLSNDISFVGRSAGLLFQIGFSHALDRIYQDSGHSWTYNALIINTKLHKKLNDFALSVKGNYALSGYNQSDYFLKFKMSYEKDDLQAEAFVSSSGIQANFIDQNFYSSAVSWSNDFDAIQIQRAKISAHYQLGQSSVKGSILYQITDNFIYGAMPIQFDKTINTFAAQLDYHYKSKPFSALIKARYLSNTHSAVIPRPKYAGSASLYTSLFLFKKNLETQWGLESQWFSSFDAPIYIPYTRRWALTGEEFNYYSPISLFVNAKVKSFNFGITIFHLQQGFASEAYYSSPTYPIMPRAVRLNIRWDMAN